MHRLLRPNPADLATSLETDLQPRVDACGCGLGDPLLLLLLLLGLRLLGLL